MVIANTGTPMSFGGYDTPAAALRLFSVGCLEKKNIISISSGLTKIISEDLGVDTNRV